jgi:hypothetical protein
MDTENMQPVATVTGLYHGKFGGCGEDDVPLHCPFRPILFSSVPVSFIIYLPFTPCICYRWIHV